MSTCATKNNLYSRSQQAFQTAQNLIPGGVNSPVRAFSNLKLDPIFIKNAAGAYLYDVDNNKYIDYIASWGAIITQHNDPKIKAAICQQLAHGMSFGTATQLESQLAEKISEMLPSIEKIRMVSSGTEAVMSAIRLARGFTGRNKIIKFTGCYHGHCDSLLVAAGSGNLTFNKPSSKGIPQDFTQHTLLAEYNDINSVMRLCEQHPHDIAAIIIEPIAGNMNFIKAQQDFLNQLRKITQDYNALLIFDEVMSGFRVAQAGAQSLYNITPDLTTLGKVIGGGMPVGAFGGRADIMDYLAPNGPVYQAGTLSGHPVTMCAGLTALNIIQQDKNFYSKLNANTKNLTEGVLEILQQAKIPACADYSGGMFGLFLGTKALPQNYSEVKQLDLKFFNKLYPALLRQGLFFAPSAFEAGFITHAHSSNIIAESLQRFAAACAA